MDGINPLPWPSSSSGGPLLGANSVGATLELIEDGGSCLPDYLKVSPVIGLDEGARLAGCLPLMLHLDLPMCGDAPPSEKWLHEVGRWLTLASAPWTSVHIIHFAFGMPRSDAVRAMTPDRALQNAARNARVLMEALPVPLLTENQTPFPGVPHAWVYEPDFVHEVVERSGCGFLLDLAHARVSADALGVEVHSYLRRLPLDRVVEMHVNGPRRLDERSAERQARALAEGRDAVSPFCFGAASLMDAHEPPREQDYALLRWVLARWRPKAITVEYDREPGPLRESLERLRAMLDR